MWLIIKGLKDEKMQDAREPLKERFSRKK